MFRLNKEEKGGATLITVDGHLSEDSIDVVESFCTSAISSGKHVRLNLRDVSRVDRACRGLLWRLAKRGVEIQAAGVYTSYVVEDIRRTGAKKR